MPIHDWTRVDSGTFHDFHQGWTIELKHSLNRGLLPSDFMAVVDLKAEQRTKLAARAETDDTAYTRKANRIVIKHVRGDLVAAIEVVSPGNKNNKNGIASFVSKMTGYLRNDINVVVIDLFPPGPRDPEGIHQVIWDDYVGLPSEPRPADKPLTIASYDAGELTAYVDPVAVGDPRPDAPLFLAAGWYVNIPLERTYQASWAETPQPIRELVEEPHPVNG